MNSIYYTLDGTKKYSNLFMAYDALPTEKRIQNIDNWLDRWIMLNERGKILNEYFDRMRLLGFEDANLKIKGMFLDWLERNPAYFSKAGIKRVVDFKVGDKVKVVNSNVLPLRYVCGDILMDMDISKSVLMRYAYDEIRPVAADNKELTIIAIKDEAVLVEEHKISKVWLYNVANLDLIEGQ